MELKWIGCPTLNVNHETDPDSLVCVTCGAENIEYSEDQARRIATILDLTTNDEDKIGGSS